MIEFSINTKSDINIVIDVIFLMFIVALLEELVVITFITIQKITKIGTHLF